MNPIELVHKLAEIKAKLANAAAVEAQISQAEQDFAASQQQLHLQLQGLLADATAEMQLLQASIPLP